MGSPSPAAHSNAVSPTAKIQNKATNVHDEYQWIATTDVQQQQYCSVRAHTCLPLRPFVIHACKPCFFFNITRSSIALHWIIFKRITGDRHRSLKGGGRCALGILHRHVSTESSKTNKSCMVELKWMSGIERFVSKALTSFAHLLDRAFRVWIFSRTWAVRRRQVSARVRLRDCNSVMISWVRVDSCGVAVAGREVALELVVVLVLLPIIGDWCRFGRWWVVQVDGLLHGQSCCGFFLFWRCVHHVHVTHTAWNTAWN